MSIKKMLLLSGMTLIAGQAVMAQETPTPATAPGQGATPAGTPQWSSRDMTYRGKGYDVLDSAYYTKKQSKQYHQYMEHQTAFPPMPRNQFEVGLGFGNYTISGDIPSLGLLQKGGGGIHLHVRKAWGYVFSTRLQYIYGVAKSLDVQSTVSYGAPYSNFGYTPLNMAGSGNPTAIYRAIRMESSQLNLDLIFNIKNISFHQARNQFSFYGYFGLGGLAYKTRVNALDGNYAAYKFTGAGGIITTPSSDNKKVRKELQSKMDKSYETAAEKSNNATTILDKKTLDFAPSLGAGVSYKINKKINISIEDRYTFPSDDYLDGTSYGKPIGNQMSVSQGPDGVNYFSVGVNYNVPLKKKAVEPLYWMNPLDHAYNELSYPRHMLLPNPVLPDEDNDGVTDQFDKCPKTPASVAVDGHGCPMDTDGDGVPDYKDKQLITPTECQPVDADGVGHCPCPDDCGGEGGTKGSKGVCKHVQDGVIRFANSSNLTPAIEAQLATLASQMKMDPNCKVVVMGGGNGSKKKEQQAWERVNNIITYMTDKQAIARDRFIFQYDKGDDVNVVMFRSAEPGETGPSTTPPPHPELK
jgi:OOP family OmpA-OmpF porin